MDESKKVGKRWCVMEALGYIIGTVVEETPFKLVMGADAVWVRNFGSLANIPAGNTQEVCPLPHVEIKDHAIRYLFPWPHKTPK